MRRRPCSQVLTWQWDGEQRLEHPPSQTQDLHSNLSASSDLPHHLGLPDEELSSRRSDHSPRSHRRQGTWRPSTAPATLPHHGCQGTGARGAQTRHRSPSLEEKEATLLAREVHVSKKCKTRAGAGKGLLRRSLGSKQWLRLAGTCSGDAEPPGQNPLQGATLLYEPLVQELGGPRLLQPTDAGLGVRPGHGRPLARCTPRPLMNTASPT